MKTARPVKTSHDVASSREGTTTQVRVAFHEDGTSTLTGVHHQHFRAIFTSASIRCHDELTATRARIKKQGGAATPEDLEALRYYTDQLAIITAIQTGRELCVEATHRKPGRDTDAYTASRYEGADEKLARDLTTDPWY